MSAYHNQLDAIARNTVTVMTTAPQWKGKWSNTLDKVRSDAVASKNHQMVTLVDAVMRLVDMNDLNIKPLGLSGSYATCWARILKGLANLSKNDLIMQTLLAFLNARGDTEKGHIFDKEHDTLCNDQIVKIFSNLLEQYREAPEVVNQLMAHRILLKHWCEEGLGTFLSANGVASHEASLSSFIGDLPTLLERLDQPPQSLQDLSQRVTMCRAVLHLIDQNQQPRIWAVTQIHLGDALTQTLHGDLARNIEEAIDAYRKAMTILTHETHPAIWATIMNNLANAYSKRLVDDRAQNLEIAIATYEDALTVRTRESMPEDWAQTLDNLATTYAERLKGDRSQNIEAAIALYNDALSVRTRETMPVDWAQTSNNLAATYFERLQEARAQNIEMAIELFQKVLQVRTRDAMPEEWAQTEDNLANAYSERLTGDRADNLEEAISLFHEVLTVRTPETTPVQWAQTLSNLAAAYLDRVRGDHTENIEKAIRLFHDVLIFMSPDVMPDDWATVMNNLAGAYYARQQGDRTENIEESISAYRAALSIRKRETSTSAWARTMTNLATAYRVRMQGDKAMNIEKALALYGKVSSTVKRNMMPIVWATAMNNMALAYSERQRGDHAENLERAFFAYQEALAVYTRELFPADHLLSMRNLGNLYFREGRWDKGLESYQNAIATGDVLLDAAHTEEGRRTEVAETAQLYARATYCLLKMGRSADAFLMLEQGKARWIAEALALSEADLSLLPEGKRAGIIGARTQLRRLETEIRLPPNAPFRRDDRTLGKLIVKARADLNTLIMEARRDYPGFMPIGVSLSSILTVIPPGGALVAPLVTSHGSAIFVIPHGASEVASEHVIWIDGFTEQALSALLVGVEDESGWLRQYGAYSVASINSEKAVKYAAWKATMAPCLKCLWDMLLAPVHEHLTRIGAQRVILMPSGGLQLLPLHAAWREENGRRRYFIDDYEMSNIPSGYTLNASHQRKAARTDRSALLAGVGAAYNKFLPLPNTVHEVQVVARMLGTEPLTDQAATRETVFKSVRGMAYLHFACHGGFAWGTDPLASALFFAGDEAITLAEIITQMDLSACRLVTLSACETGLTDTSQSPDEFIGLPAGFIQAGAAAVISSLWAVDDRSTALLMERFYKNHIERGMPHAASLRDAQMWLRDITRKELGEYYESYLRMSVEQAEENYTTIVAGGAPDNKPYSHPFFWAGFTYTGA